jgi:NADPH-dependent ferric siderophore reductase
VDVLRKAHPNPQLGRLTLSGEDISHYQRVVVALKETIRLMMEIDKVIPGWPIK